MTNYIFAQDSDNIKDHYYYFSADYMVPVYTEPIRTRVEAVQRVPEISHVPVQADALGYYKRKGAGLLYGVMIHVIVDRYWTSGNHLQIEQYQASLSGIYFMDRPAGENGVFIRSDAGPALLRISSGDSGTEHVLAGYGFLAGTGYLHNIYSRACTISAQYSLKLFRLKAYSALSFGIGVMI